VRIVINHLTRMQPGFICAAGIDAESERHVRPVLRGRLSHELLATHGGPFAIGTWVDLGPTIYAGSAPEVEDYAFTHHVTRAVSVASPTDFWSLLQRVAKPRLADIFGPGLDPNGGGYAIAKGRGLASLGCLIPTGQPELRVFGTDRLRLRSSDGALDVMLTVTDVRFYDGDEWSLQPTVVSDVQRRLQRGVPVVLSVGLTRPWQKPGDSEERHWLQVNGIHLADDPLWRTVGSRVGH
jgi:hypothetical protein